MPAPAGIQVFIRRPGFSHYFFSQPTTTPFSTRTRLPNRFFPHDLVDDGLVNHSKRQYVVGAIHTNTIEGFGSILKRGMVGTYHKVSPKYLPLHVAEFAFQYNNRQNDDIFGAAISGC